MKTKMQTAHAPLELANKVDQMAARLGRSRGRVMKQPLLTWVDLEEDRDRLTREALADIDAWHVNDHQAAQACAKGF